MRTIRNSFVTVSADCPARAGIIPAARGSMPTTPDVGLPSKACNLRLEREAAAVARDPRQPDDLRSLAGFVASFAASKASSPTPSVLPARFSR